LFEPWLLVGGVNVVVAVPWEEEMAAMVEEVVMMMAEVGVPPHHPYFLPWCASRIEEVWKRVDKIVVVIENGAIQQDLGETRQLGRSDP
jgi:hypothetical protein